MKKRFLLLITISLLTCGSAVYAGSGFGIKGGVNYAGSNARDISSDHMLIGYHAGLFLKLGISDHWAIQPELLYSLKGSELTFNQPYASGTARFRLTYFDVPLLMVFNPVEVFNLHGGIYLSSLSKAKVKNISSSAGFDFENNINADDFHRLDFGLIIGAGLDFDHLNFGVRYNYGAIPVGKKYDFSGTVKRFPDARNSVIQLYAGLRIF